MLIKKSLFIILVFNQVRLGSTLQAWIKSDTLLNKNKLPLSSDRLQHNMMAGIREANNSQTANSQ